MFKDMTDTCSKFSLLQPKHFVALGFVIILSIINIPGIPITFQIIFYLLLLIMSMAASMLVFRYYSSIPDNQHSLMTTGVKSVIAWHMVAAASTYLYLGTSSLMWTQVIFRFDIVMVSSSR